MRPVLPDEAVDFGRAARGALATIGGVDLARQAETDPSVRTTKVAPVLAGLGVPGLDPREDATSASAAAELCREAGRIALPYPVAAFLLADADGVPFSVVDPPSLRVDHADLAPTWNLGTLDGRCGTAASSGAVLHTRLGPFTGDLVPEADLAAGRDGSDAAWHLTLTAWTILGGLEAAVELAVAHVSQRVQFGQAISDFQAVQFQLADAAVAVDGLRELSKFTLWRVGMAGGAGVTDALALRLHALDAARLVLRTTQQLHGASGLCDEYDISIICRHLQPALRLPFGAARAADALFDAVERNGFDSLFPHGADARS